MVSKERRQPDGVANQEKLPDRIDDGRFLVEVALPIAEQLAKSEQISLPTYVLTFRTANGDVLVWGIQTGVAPHEIPHCLENAAEEWLLSPAGRDFIAAEDLREWGFDYANALMEIPTEILAKHGLHLLVSSYDIVELDTRENLLPDEFRK